MSINIQNTERLRHEIPTLNSKIKGFNIVDILYEETKKEPIATLQLKANKQHKKKKNWGHITRWEAFLQSEINETVMEYGFCGDINRSVVSEKPLDDFLSTGESPEQIFYQFLKERGLQPKTVVIEITTYFETRYHKMTVGQIIELAECMSEDNPILSVPFRKYLKRFDKVMLGNKKKVTRRNERLERIYREIKKYKYEGQVDETSFALVCWTRNITAEKAAKYFKNIESNGNQD